jgi:hypothetical protein
MPLTSLEAIAEKLQENRQNQLEDILRVSGSNAIAKDEYGITSVNETNVATSLLFKSLNKSKFDINELKKAIDIDVTELRPDIPVPVKDLVPKSLYDEEVVLNTNLTNENEVLNTTIESLNIQIETLKTELDTEKNNRLNVEQSNTTLVNQAAALNKSIEDLSKQIQTALQKSAEESVLRGSLQAQNAGYKSKMEALIKQIDSLNSMVEGLQSQLGGVPAGTNIQTSQTSPGAPPQVVTIETLAGVDITKLDKIETIVKGDYWAGLQEKFIINAGDTRTINNSKIDWKSGKSIQLSNNNENPVDIKIEIQSPEAQNGWLYSPKTEFTLNPGDTEKIDFIIDLSKIQYRCDKPYAPTNNTFVGQLQIKIMNKDGKQSNRIWQTVLVTQNPYALYHRSVYQQRLQAQQNNSNRR